MPPERNESRDEESGKYIKQFEDEDFINAVKKLDADGTSEIAAELGASYDTAYKRLRALEKEGRINCREIGNAYLWTYPGPDADTESESNDTPDQ